MHDDTDGESAERIKRVTLRFPVELHRRYRHRAVDQDTTLELATLAALTEWATAAGTFPPPTPPALTRPWQQGYGWPPAST